MSEKPADGRAHDIEALLTYMIERDATARRRFEEKTGIPFHVFLEWMDGEPFIECWWKH